MTATAVSRLERRAGAVLVRDGDLGPEWRVIRERVIAALADHPAERLEVEALPLDQRWRHGLFQALPPGSAANEAVVMAVERLRDAAAARDAKRTTPEAPNTASA